MTRLTDAELDALLEAHKACQFCDPRFPCETWRLATEVKDRRDEAKAYAMVARYEEGGR